MRSFKAISLILIVWVSLLWSFWFAGNPFVWNLLWTQLEIWLSQRSTVWTFRDGRAWNSLVLQQEVSSQNNFDLIAELDKAKSETERLGIIDQYIESLNSVISNGKDLGNYEQSQVDYYNSAAKECEAPIKWKNSEFAEAVKNYNYDRAESIAEEIKNSKNAKEVLHLRLFDEDTYYNNEVFLMDLEDYNYFYQD